jgi:hypothetical protein
MNRKLLIITVLSIISSFLYAQEPTSGCELPINNIFYDYTTGDVWYNVDFDIGGFQWTVDGTTISEASGGDAEEASFTIQTDESSIIGFFFGIGGISSGCGTLTQLTLDGVSSGFSEIVFSDPLGTMTNVSHAPAQS